MLTSLQPIIDGFAPITLEEMSGIRLMNRIDSKYLASESQLLKLLEHGV